MDGPYILRLSTEGAEYCSQNNDAAYLAAAMTDPRTGFRVFLDYCYFRPEGGGGTKTLLGPSLWAAQEEFVRQTTLHDFIFFLKARKLGETTIEEAFDAWVARFRDVNARVHMFSRRDDAATESLGRVKFMLTSLPWWLRLPVETDNDHEFVMVARTGEKDSDLRTIKAYPTSDRTADEASCTHAHVDELAKMAHPDQVWQTIEPQIVPGGSCHILTTGLGAGNWASEYYDMCRKGEGRHVPVFIDSLQRPDRNQAWLDAKRKEFGNETRSKQEYPMIEDDALYGGGDLVFTHEEIQRAGVDSYSLGPPVRGRKYVKGVDVGRHQDACVILVLDITGRDPRTGTPHPDVKHVVYYKRLREATYPQIQHEIEWVDKAYRGPLGIEKNSAGEAVIENLNIPEERANAAKFNTSHTSKPRIISQVKLELQNDCLKWPHAECPELTVEMSRYQIPDDNIIQDSVIALAIAVEYAGRDYGGGVRAVSTIG